MTPQLVLLRQLSPMRIFGHYFTVLLVAILCVTASTRLQAGTLAQGEAYLNSKEYDQAWIALYPLAQAGDRKAQSWIGVMCENGWGTQESQESALRWYSASAIQDYGPAQWKVALFLISGKGREADL